MTSVNPQQPGPGPPPAGPKGARAWLRGLDLGDPHVTYAGAAAVWWIPRPRGPRISLLTAAITWLVALPITAATAVWSRAQSNPLWPFVQPVTSGSEMLLRYEIVLLVCLVYVTLRSLPLWYRHYRLARRDARAIDAAIAGEHWETAGLLVHRYCLMVSAIWRRVPARVAAWDELLRRKLPRHRRLYVYYHRRRPALPPDPTVSFTPAVIPPPQPSLWSALALIPVALLLYPVMIEILRNRNWGLLILLNAALLAAILVSYGTYFLLTLLGRSYYFRFAPGVVQLVKYRLGRRRPGIESYDLRQVHAVLDLSSRWPGLTLLDTPGYKRETFRLPRGDDVVETVLRASLSSAPSLPLPEEMLID